MVDTQLYDEDSNWVGRIVIQPNRSLSWRALQYFLIVLMAVSFGIALSFLFAGYWMILPFTGIEMLFLTGCLWLCLRRASTQEVLTFGAHTVTLEVGAEEPEETTTWERYYTKIQVQSAVHPWYAKTVSLVHRGESTTIGERLTHEEREILIKALGDMVRLADRAMIRDQSEQALNKAPGPSPVS